LKQHLAQLYRWYQRHRCIKFRSASCNSKAHYHTSLQCTWRHTHWRTTSG